MTTTASTAPRGDERVLDGPPPTRFLESLLARARTLTADWVRIVVPTPTRGQDAEAGPLSTLAMWPERPSLVWTDDATTVVGIDVAHSATGSGPERFAQVIEATRGTPLVSVLGDASLPLSPWIGELRYLGGGAFAAGDGGRAPWTSFPDAWFALPRWLFVCEQNQTWLVLTVRPKEADDPRWGDDAQRLLQAASGDHVTGSANTSIAWRDDGDPHAWHTQVASVRAAIEEGGIVKAASARTTALRWTRAPSIGDALLSLARSHPDCTRFAIRPAGGACFLGATPERLISRRGSLVRSDALAGSRPRDDSDERACAELLASDKDRREHSLVVDAIAETVAPRCRWFPVPTTPSVRTLRHVHHLCTELAGELADVDDAGNHVLALAALLHPTPAVGGTPRAAALSVIAATEALPRGWYAGPVGWFSPSGDGELAVAIRSALLDGDSAIVWAGAGIVAGSDPTAEWHETRVKQRAMLVALGGDSVPGGAGNSWGNV